MICNKKQFDVIKAFLKVDMDGFMVVILQGHAADAILNTNEEEYRKYVVNTKSS